MIWLDDLHNYLNPAAGHLTTDTAVALVEVLNSHENCPVLIAATTWLSYWADGSAQPLTSLTPTEDRARATVSDLLRKANVSIRKSCDGALAFTSSAGCGTRAPGCVICGC